MKIRIKSSMSIGRFNAYRPGQIVDLPDNVADRLVRRGIADAMTGKISRDEPVETQIVQSTEAALPLEPAEAQVINPDEAAGGRGESPDGSTDVG